MSERYLTESLGGSPKARRDVIDTLWTIWVRAYQTRRSQYTRNALRATLIR